jgi:hypothetical protein
MVTKNIPFKADPRRVSDLVLLKSDNSTVILADHMHDFYCYGKPKLPSEKSCVIMLMITNLITNGVDYLWMVGSSGSQFDFTCDWSDRLTGDYKPANTEK